LGNQVVSDLRVTQPIDREPKEYSASLDGTLQFVDKDIIPSGSGGEFGVTDLKERWFASFQPAFDLAAKHKELASFQKD
jgi:hypothetical protein